MFYRPIDAELQLTLAVPNMAEELFALTDANRAWLRTWLPWLDTTQSPADTQVFIVHTLGEFAQGKGVHAAIQLKGRICGMVSFNRIDHQTRTGYIGYWIAADHTGRGIVTRAVRELLRLGYEHLVLEHSVIRAATGNAASNAVARRLGFSHVRIIPEAEELYGRKVDQAEWHHAREQS